MDVWQFYSPSWQSKIEQPYFEMQIDKNQNRNQTRSSWSHSLGWLSITDWFVANIGFWCWSHLSQSISIHMREWSWYITMQFECVKVLTRIEYEECYQEIKCQTFFAHQECWLKYSFFVPLLTREHWVPSHKWKDWSLSRRILSLKIDTKSVGLIVATQCA